MRDISDLGRIAYVLNNFDTVILAEKRSKKFRDKTGRNAKVAIFAKRIDGHVYTTEAVTDSTKKRLMCVHSMYKKFDNKKGVENSMPTKVSPS